MGDQMEPLPEVMSAEPSHVSLLDVSHVQFFYAASRSTQHLRIDHDQCMCWSWFLLVRVRERQIERHLPYDLTFKLHSTL